MSDRARARAERSLRIYPWFLGCLSAYAWMPVFFLYLQGHVGLAGALRLEAIYYLAVVLAEVPSGYFSDRIGRRPTLLAAASLIAAACACFALGQTFAVLALAQVLLALGIAFQSGTDTSLHYGLLHSLGREEEFAAREARIGRAMFWVFAAAALVGGLVGSVDLRLPYLVTGAAALGGVALALAMSEPSEGPRAASFSATLSESIRRTRQPGLRWLFAVAVVATVVNHIPYEFLQPWLASLDGPAETPLLAGLHAAAVFIVAAPVAGRSAAWAERIGLRRHLLLAVLLQVLLVCGMAWRAHPLIAALVLLRSWPRALMQAPLRAAVAPQLPASLRATWLSLQSLAGRLGFSLLLISLSLGAGEEAWQGPLRASAVVAVLLWVVLAVAGRRSLAAGAEG